jgi:hypothetical protein
LDLPPIVFVQPPPAPPIPDANPPASNVPPVVFVQPPPIYPPPSPPIVTLVQPPPSDAPALNDTLDQPAVDTPPIIEARPPPPVIPPIPDTANQPPDTTYPRPPAIAAHAPGNAVCVLRWVGPALYYLRRDLNAAFPVPDLDVARVKCDFSGATGSCISGFPSDDPDPDCRLGPSGVIREPLQMDHCLFGTIDMSRANNCLPVAWVKSQLVQIDGQLLYVRLDSKTLYPVSKAVADRKGLTDVMNCDLPLLGYCGSIRKWNIGPSVQVDTCLGGTIPMSRAQECTPPL